MEQVEEEIKSLISLIWVSFLSSFNKYLYFLPSQE